MDDDEDETERVEAGRGGAEVTRVLPAGPAPQTPTGSLSEAEGGGRVATGLVSLTGSRSDMARFDCRADRLRRDRAETNVSRSERAYVGLRTNLVDRRGGGRGSSSDDDDEVDVE